MRQAHATSLHGPLTGVRILDLTRVLAGPWASQLLADYGAEVIKVERPGAGDDTRQWGPPWLDSVAETETRDSAYFLSANRNKRSITVDLSDRRGADIIRSLAAQSDVVLENFRVGTMARFGLGYESLKAQNPALIYCAISAYGQSGSRANRPGYDAMIQASGGLMSVTGEAGGPPQKVGVAIADIMAGMYAATAVLAALVECKRSGRGQYIDVPLYDSQVAWLANQNMNFLVGSIVPGRLGTAHPNLVPYQAFETSDGYLMLAIGNDAQFRACCLCLGLDELADDPRFARNADRVRHRDSLVALLTKAFAGKDTTSWLAALDEHGIPAGPINSIGDVLSDGYAEERSLVRTLMHPTGNAVPTVANPVRFSDTPVEYRRAPPQLGEHTDAVLSDLLDMDEAAIQDLRESGVI